MSEIPEVRENIQNGIQSFQQSTTASKEASAKIGEAQHFLALASGGLIHVIQDIRRAEKLFDEVAGSYGDMASNAESGTDAFKNAAGSAPHESTPSNLIYHAEELAKGGERLAGQAGRMSSEHLSGIRNILEGENRRLGGGIADWKDKVATTDSYSEQVVPQLIVQRAEQWRDSI